MYNGIYEQERFAYLHHTLEKWLRLRLNGSGLGENLTRSGVRTVAVYGVGGLGEDALADLRNSQVRVLCLIDRRAAEYSNGVGGLPVFDIDGYRNAEQADIVLVTPEFAFRPIADSLLEAGIPMERIVSLAMALEENGGNANEAMAGNA